MSLQPIPAERIAQILENLHGEHATLYACRLASFQFIHPSQRLLYSSIRLHPTEVKLQAILEIAASSPRLLEYTNSLSHVEDQGTTNKSGAFRMDR
ncbi:hypothetical protein BDN72DRAFT_835661 [Pluteus cervinus]|uniref:Uncharacterized protein n=1 Tax=Pluteus cervinus TaxID=181527 RepID=A0ACD3B3B0_9AGAR|nr:hypothetical protein BDN72DRAFT_835661 [Pluteus cervinus]